MGNIANKITGVGEGIWNATKSVASDIYGVASGVTGFLSGGLNKFESALDQLAGIPVLGAAAEFITGNPLYGTISGAVRAVDEIVQEVGTIGGTIGTVIDRGVFGGDRGPVVGTGAGLGGTIRPAIPDVPLVPQAQEGAQAFRSALAGANVSSVVR